MAKSIKEYLEKESFHVISQPLKNDSTRFNLLIKKSADSKPKLLFNTHMDTVPPYLPPKQNDGIISGRGSNDAKGQIAAMIFALKRLAEEQPNLANQVGLLLVVGEETDHIGMIEANDLDLSPDYLVVGEPTGKINF